MQLLPSSLGSATDVETSCYFPAFLVTFHENKWADGGNVHVTSLPTAAKKNICCARSVLSSKLHSRGESLDCIHAWKALLHPGEHNDMQRITRFILGLTSYTVRESTSFLPSLQLPLVKTNGFLAYFKE